MSKLGYSYLVYYGDSGQLKVQAEITCGCANSFPLASRKTTWKQPSPVDKLVGSD